MILSDIAIRQAIDAKRIGITPFDEQDLKGASYDFHLAPYFRVFIPHNETCIDPMVDQQHLTTPYSVRAGDVFVLHPGQFALASSIERFFFGRWNAGRLEGKSSLARLGLIIHSAGFFDPGFNGHATLELANPTSLPIKLYPGMLIGQMAFYAVQGDVSPSKLYGGVAANSKYQHQGEAPAPSRYFENYPDGPPNVGVTDIAAEAESHYNDLFERFPDPSKIIGHGICAARNLDYGVLCILPLGHDGPHNHEDGLGKGVSWPTPAFKMPDFRVARTDMESEFVDVQAQVEASLREARPMVMAFDPERTSGFLFRTRDGRIVTQDEIEEALKERGTRE